MPSDTSRVGRRSPARLEVRLLGAVEVVLDGRRLGAFDSLRLQRFLASIALRRDLQHRSRLAFEHWPDSDERQARTNLNLTWIIGIALLILAEKTVPAGVAFGRVTGLLLVASGAWLAFMTF